LTLKRTVIIIIIVIITNTSEMYLANRRMPNDVSNQQDATTFSFINLFESALRVSSDEFARPQGHFLTMYSLWYNAPTLLLTVATAEMQPVSSSVGALYPKMCMQSKSAPEDGRHIRPSSGALFEYVQLMVQCTDTAADRFHLSRGTGQQQCRCIVPKAVYTVKKCS
jgi:hypothetical protein